MLKKEARLSDTEISPRQVRRVVNLQKIWFIPYRKKGNTTLKAFVQQYDTVLSHPLCYQTVLFNLEYSTIRTVAYLQYGSSYQEVLVCFY